MDVIDEEAAVVLSSSSTTATNNKRTEQQTKLVKKKQSNLTDFVTNSKPLSINKSKLIDQQLIKMIVKEYYPFSIVEGPEFKKFICVASRLQTS